LKTTRLPFKTLAFEYLAFTSTQEVQIALFASAYQACRNYVMNTKTNLSNTKISELVDLIHRNSFFVEKLSEILNLQEENSTPVKSTHAQTPPDVSKLKISFDNDSTILVQSPQIPPIPYDCRQLGFRDHRTKTWRFFTEILTSHDHTINFGIAYAFPDGSWRNRVKNKDYDARWKLCDELNRKLLAFFKKEFGWEFAKGYKLYEKANPDQGDHRRFKFVIDPPSSERSLPAKRSSIFGDIDGLAELHYSKLDEDQLIKEIRSLNDDFSVDSAVHNADPDNLITAYTVGREKFGWTDEVMRELIQV